MLDVETKAPNEPQGAEPEQGAKAEQASSLLSRTGGSKGLATKTKHLVDVDSAPSSPWSKFLASPSPPIGWDVFDEAVVKDEGDGLGTEDSVQQPQ